MNPKLQNKLIKIAKDNRFLPNAKNKHFTFVIRRNNILSVGWNDINKSHTFCKKHHYSGDFLHSEIAALLRFKQDKNELKNCVLVNVRVNRFGSIRYSKPCRHCLRWILDLDLRSVWYTNSDGLFERLL